MKLSLIVPCYNEEFTIKDIIKSLIELKLPIDKEIIIVDDGSHKNHKRILEEELKNGNVKCYRLKKNQGKGVAIRMGLKFATGDIFIIQDADFEYYPTDIPKLLEPILHKNCSVVYGSRFLGNPENMSASHLVGNVILTNLTNRLFKCNITDMETGYKLFTREVLDTLDLEAREFEFEPEITAKVILNGFKIKELPITYKYRESGVAKINMFDGFESVLVLIQQRFFRNSTLFRKFYHLYKFHFKKYAGKVFDKLFGFLPYV